MASTLGLGLTIGFVRISFNWAFFYTMRLFPVLDGLKLGVVITRVSRCIFILDGMYAMMSCMHKIDPLALWSIEAHVPVHIFMHTCMIAM